MRIGLHAQACMKSMESSCHGRLEWIAGSVIVLFEKKGPIRGGSGCTGPMTSTVDIAPSLLDELRTFRLAKRSSKGAALVAKIDKNKLLIEKEEILDPITPEELEEELPEHSPRFVVLSTELHHADGRISYVRTLRATYASLLF